MLPVALALALALAPGAVAAIDFAPTANLQYDWARFDPDARPFANDHDFRRGRIGFRLRDEGGKWQIAYEYDPVDHAPADAVLELAPAKGHAIRIGQFKQPFSLEDAVSDKATPFLEPAHVGTFAISRRIGIEYARFGARGTFNAAVFGKRLDGSNESTGAAMRATWIPGTPREGAHRHVGLSLASESPDNARASFSVAPGTALTALRLASTGAIQGVDRLDRAALEALWMRSAWSLQAEVAAVATHGDGPGFEGQARSVQATWSPSGDARSYKRGATGAPAADNAWELALRWSAIDLDDGSVAGGRVEQVGVAATWYRNRHLRVIGNVLRFDSRRGSVSDDPLVASLRLQLTY